MAKKPVSDQMELFEDGGFKDQGKTKDPISKNPVPVGSTQEEVRDDIPAQLSEGEFVLPADVVRYHGLEKIMGIRDQAKQGLQKMENMGQMGNSDQATIPDGVPFKQMADGGVVPGVNIQGPTTQLTKPSMFTPPAQVQGPQVSQPVTVQTPQAPTYASSQVQQKSPYTFEQAIGTPFGQQQQSETRVYVNNANEKLYIPFVNGQPIYPIPAGYTQESVAEKEKEQEQTVTDVRARSATTQQDSGDDSVGIKSTVVSDLAKAAQKGKFGDSLAQVGKFLTSPLTYIAGKAFGDGEAKGQFMSAQEIADEEADIAGTGAGTPQDPASILEANSYKAFQTAIRNSSVMFGTTPTMKTRKETGDVDIASNGVYHASGLAMNADGSASLTEQGTVSYKSFADFSKHMSASFDTGWHGSTISKDEYFGTGVFQGKGLSKDAQEKYSSWADKLGYNSTGGTKKASVEKDDRFRSGEDFSNNKNINIPTTKKTTTSKDGVPVPVGRPDYFPSQITQGNISRDKISNSKVNIDPRVADPMIDPSEFASATKASKSAIGKLTDPKIGRSTKYFEEFMNRQPKNTRTQAFQNLERNKEMAKAINEMSEGATNIPTSYGITDDIYSNFNDNNDDPGGGGTSSSGDSSSSSDMGFSTASGGFIQRKNLPKANKKKRGGLASR